MRNLRALATLPSVMILIATLASLVLHALAAVSPDAPKLTIIQREDAVGIYGKGHSYIFTRQSQRFNEEDVSIDGTRLVSLGLLGAFSIVDDKYTFIASVRDRENVGMFFSKSVWRVSKVDFIAISAPLAPDDVWIVDEMLERAHQILVDGFYYSEDLDLSVDQQSQHQRVRDAELTGFYLGNRPMRDSLFHLGIPDSLLLKAIRGYVGIREHELPSGDQMFLALISRTSPSRIGTRYQVRGGHVDGNVVNDVGSELVLWTLDKQHIVSFVQTRGSVPLLWMETGRRIILNSNPEYHRVAIKNHFEMLGKLYNGEILVVNLLETTGREVLLSTQYNNLAGKTANVAVVQFPFHQEVPKAGWKSKLIKSISPTKLQSIGFYASHHGTTTSVQKGVVRTNCLDCMDRTSQVHQVTLEAVLFAMISALFSGATVGIFPSDLDAIKLQLIDMSNENAHTISRHYSGSRALRTEVGRYGHPTYSGFLVDMFSSTKRALQQALWDAKKQSGINAVFHFDPAKDYPKDGWEDERPSCGDADTLGVVYIREVRYFVHITGAELIGTFGQLPIYQVSAVGVEPVKDSAEADLDVSLRQSLEEYLVSSRLFYSTREDISKHSTFLFNRNLLEDQLEDSVKAISGDVHIAKFDDFDGVETMFIERQSVENCLIEIELTVRQSNTQSSVSVLISPDTSGLQLEELFPGKRIIRRHKGIQSADCEDGIVAVKEKTDARMFLLKMLSTVLSPEQSKAVNGWLEGVFAQQSAKPSQPKIFSGIFCYLFGRGRPKSPDNVEHARELIHGPPRKASPSRSGHSPSVSYPSGEDKLYEADEPENSQ